MLVSEPACCPFCVQPEFGITYEPPPFRRGLVYGNSHQNSLGKAASAMSSTTSLTSQGPTSPGRRRAGSLAATDASVITTDRVRPDWAKKLADARAHALRRAAAATALHNAAYMMGNIQSDNRGFSIGRRRRTMFGGDSASTSGNGTPRGDVNALLVAAGSSSRNEGQSDLTSNRQSSRRGNRLEDLEDLMMMEAIRLSLAAEEERKKKEEKEAAKEAKKEEKKKAKEAKKAEKAARKSGFFMSPSQDDLASGSSSITGKGKAADRSGGYAGFNPMSEPTSTLNASSSKDDPQKHLEQSRSTLNTSLQREISSTGTTHSAEGLGGEPGSHRSALRDLSNPSSSTSSFAESMQGSLQNESHGNFGASTSSFGPSPNASGVSLGGADDTPPQGTPGTEPMFNFRSLAEVITKEKDTNGDNAQHIENVTQEDTATSSTDHNTPAPASGERTSPLPPKIEVEPPKFPMLPEMEPMSPLDTSIATLKPSESDRSFDSEDGIESAPRIEAVKHDSTDLDHKHIGNVSMVDRIEQHQPTQ